MTDYKASDLDSRLMTGFLIERRPGTTPPTFLPCKLDKDGDYWWVEINQFDETMRTRADIDAILEECRARGYEWAYVTNGLKMIRIGKKCEPADNEEEVHIDDISIIDADDYLELLEALNPTLYTNMTLEWSDEERNALRKDLEEVIGCWLHIDGEDRRNLIGMCMGTRMLIDDIACEHKLNHLIAKSKT